MQWRFYTDVETISVERIAEVLEDYEQDVGIEEFGRTFSSIHPQDIETYAQAQAVVRLLSLGRPVFLQRMR